MSEAPNRRGRKIACPSCGAEVIIGGRTSQRVKCPKCTAEIPTNPPEPTTPPDSIERELAALREEVKLLRARVAVLEQAPPLYSAPEPPKPESVMVVGKLQWIRPPEDKQTPAPALPDPIHEKALVHNLRVLSGNQILIRSAAGNEDARRLAERFKELFTEAEWRVNGVVDLPLDNCERGLALAAGALPPTRETTRTYLAFTAAGFSLESRLDPSLQGDETMLIVA